MLVAKFPSGHVAVCAAATDVVLASATDVEDENVFSWRPDDTCEMLFGVISSRIALSGSESDGQWFAHLQFIIHTSVGQEECGRGMTTHCRRIIDEPDALSPEF